MTGHPVLVVLVQTDLLSIRCTITRYGGTDPAGVDAHPPVVSLSMRGAQRELTSRMLSDGYQPVGRWVTTGNESTRKFREGTS